MVPVFLPGQYLQFLQLVLHTLLSRVFAAASSAGPLASPIHIRVPQGGPMFPILQVGVLELMTMAPVGW